MDKKEISTFYDQYTSTQKKTGINPRHRTIFRNLKKLGLQKTSKVLEIGCGIGTFSSFLAKFCSEGIVVSVDISPKSIEIARETYKNRPNIRFVVSDMSDFTADETFDFVVLPDVLEHIPVDQHAHLFKVIRRCIHEDATLLINIPAPRYLDWIRINKPELLQIIDQSISTQDLLNNAYPGDLYLHSLDTYSLHVKEGDYQSIVLKPNKPLLTVNYKGYIESGIMNFRTKLY